MTHVPANLALPEETQTPDLKTEDSKTDVSTPDEKPVIKASEVSKLDLSAGDAETTAITNEDIGPKTGKD